MAKIHVDPKYLDAYYQNEYDANKQMSIISAVIGGVCGLIWIFYLAGLFTLTQHSLFLARIALPIAMAILLHPLFFLKTSFIKRKGYKYFIMSIMLTALSFLNIVLPKHMILSWALPIVLANHYYNPRLGRIVFIITPFLMLLCLYTGMFVGEFDPYLMMGEINDSTGVIHCIYLDAVFPDTPQGRYEYLHALLQVGHNRYLTATIYYFFGRLALLSTIFLASQALNKRTYKLLIDEIRVSQEQTKIASDLNVAKDIQLSSVPTGYYCSAKAEITAEILAAKEVGGDLYFYLPMDESHIAIAIGDVSGKGIPAAMFMMKTVTLIKSLLALDKKPSQILAEVNRALYDGNDAQIFVTCFLGIIDLDNLKMVFANAGHNPPIIGTNYHYRYLPCKTGFVLGGMAETYAVDEVIPLHYGDSILLYTDGVTEARNVDGEFFGEHRLIDYLNSKDFSCPLEVSRGLVDKVQDFAGAAEQSDDMTHLLIQISDHSKTFFDERHVDAKQENIPQLLGFIEEFAKKQNLSRTLIRNLLVIGDELISNIVKYAYEDSGDIFLRLMRKDNELVITLVDHGKHFNALEEKREKLFGDASDQPVGGLGILIVKQIMTNITYDYLNKKNILILRRALADEDFETPKEK